MGAAISWEENSLVRRLESFSRGDEQSVIGKAGSCEVVFNRSIKNQHATDVGTRNACFSGGVTGFDGHLDRLVVGGPLLSGRWRCHENGNVVDGLFYVVRSEYVRSDCDWGDGGGGTICGKWGCCHCS